VRRCCTNVTRLAKTVYEILRTRIGQTDPRITYAELARELREIDPEFENVTHRSQELYTALWEVGGVCKRLKLPPLPALVVRADTRRPGDAYFEGIKESRRGERIAAWQRDFDAVRQTDYPPLG
jgi:hypothetical protein